MTQPLLLTDRPSYFPSGMHYVYDGRSKRYPRQPLLPDLSTREVLGTDVGSALGRRMIAVGPTDERIRKVIQSRNFLDDPRVTKHFHDELESREKGDRLEAAQARLAIAQKLKEGKLQDLGKMISGHQQKHPSRRIFETNTMGERPIGPRLSRDPDRFQFQDALEEELIDTGQLPAKYVTGPAMADRRGHRFDTTRPRWGEYSHVHTRPTLMLEDMPSHKRRRMHGSGESILFDDDY